jgi:type IV pilus assembly protein PilQ
MRRVSTLLAFSVCALSLSAGRANAAHANLSRDARAAHADSPAAAAVTAVSIVPGNGHAEVIVAVKGSVEIMDFALASPHRVVIDITGAKLGLVTQMYDKVTRGGIKNVRLAQYKADVVRLVLDLDEPREYTVVRGENDVRVSVVSDQQFASWHVGAPNVNAAEGRVETEAAPAPHSTFASAKPANVKFASTLQQQSQQPRITVTYQDSDVRDVLAAFAAFSGRTIVVGKEVNGTITAEIKDQPWDVALQAILQAQGLAATEEKSGIITVDSYANILNKQASEPLTTQLVSINYANASSLIETIKSLLSKDCPQNVATTAAPAGQAAPQGGAAQCLTRGSVTADSATNTLLVTEVASRLPDLLGYVRDLDVRTPQVALRAKVIAVSRTTIDQLGLSYDIGSKNTFFNTLAPRIPEGGTTPGQFESQVELGGDALATVANASRKFRNGSALNLIFSTALGKYSLTSFLDALHENDLSDIQAEPSIVTLDNKMASILVGQETPIRVIDAGSASQIGAPVRANVQFKQSGIILKVTPHITNNRQIRMSVEAEQSTLRIVGGDLGFFFDKNNAITQLLTADGETAVIGGLTQTTITRNKSGLPFFSDLPLIGKLFSQSENREEKKDLLILITPHIVDEGEAVKPPSGSGR